jgi:hypothetical protein
MILSFQAYKDIHTFFSESERGFGQQSVDRQVPRKPRLVGVVERHNGSMGTMKHEISFPGSPAQWAGSFTFEITILVFEIAH